MTGFVLRSLEAPDCTAVADLHMRYLPTPFSGATGRRLLRLYYEAVVRGNGACGYVACAGDGVAGYVCGVWDAGAVRAVLLRRSGTSLALWGGLHMLARPGMLAGLPGRLGRSAAEQGAQASGYELRPIVVAPEYRGTGVAAALVERIVADAHQRGYPRLHLLAYESDARALRFYHKAGFRGFELIEQGGTRYVRLARETVDAR